MNQSTNRFAGRVAGIALLCLASVVWSYAETGGAQPAVNSAGTVMPLDAAPLEHQVLRTFARDFKCMCQTVTGYEVAYGAYLIAEPLMRVSRDFELEPAAATHWEVSPDGLTWTFHLLPGQVFSDGRPITAHDYVNTFQWWANPATAYDFEWYYEPIQNWKDVVAGRKSVDSLGTRALDDLTLAITTEKPTPYLPSLLTYSQLTPLHAIQKYGSAWSTRPETSVSSGPYILKEWTRGAQVVLVPNPDYRGQAKPYLEKLIARLFVPGARPPFLTAYESGDVDYVKITNQSQLNRVKSNPSMQEEANSYVDFITFYLTMDTYNAPFNDLRVRQAFSHAIDRDALSRSALRGVGVPAYSMLQPGFPGENQRGLASIQRYDPELARAKLAAAGYAGGMGFPKLDIWLRSTPTGPVKVAAEAIQAMLKQTLNIDVGVRDVEIKTFMETLNAHQLPLALVPYGYDYLDPSNQLEIWRSFGRHAWQNPAFEKALSLAATMIQDLDARTALYQEAEEILVRDVGGVFLWHELSTEVWKPYLKGEALEPNKWGYRAWRGDHRNLTPTLYITNEVLKGGRATGEGPSTGFWEWLRGVL